MKSSKWLSCTRSTANSTLTHTYTHTGMHRDAVKYTKCECALMAFSTWLNYLSVRCFVCLFVWVCALLLFLISSMHPLLLLSVFRLSSVIFTVVRFPLELHYYHCLCAHSFSTRRTHTHTHPTLSIPCTFFYSCPSVQLISHKMHRCRRSDPNSSFTVARKTMRSLNGTAVVRRPARSHLRARRSIDECVNNALALMWPQSWILLLPLCGLTWPNVSKTKRKQKNITRKLRIHESKVVNVSLALSCRYAWWFPGKKRGFVLAQF